ncbi:rSAM-modified peptide [Flavobacterium piscisymbiosum]|uniref:RSAM-modified peptide n=1 Tax=Flavobacterium piscisymbiosum TaxID=2893753 RepID=A0ABS8MBE4_9FLAO|nr:rSAM-modified peptide [Flavobacterium sp. F-30]MCC9062764.1 rSAM-modified peptide [Flavobacterium sp. F-30]
MATQKLNISDFEFEKLAKNQQKTIQGGDEPVDPSKGNGKGNG